jgi:ABC-type antimicrobial peptide transport system permease subunit
MKKAPMPPRLFHRFFRWFCRPKLRDHIEGDLLELYQERVKARGKQRANLLFIADVLLLFRPGIIGSAKKQKQYNQYGMFKNYFKTAFRNLWKHKAFSLINILGLGLGLACSLLIILWVYDEYNEDSFHKNGAQLYSVFERRYNDGVINAGFATQGLMADEMKRVLPDVQYATNFAWNTLSTFEANNKILKENGNCGGADFFKMFTYPLLEGNATTALQSPVDISISKKMAEDFFGSAEEAIGKTIRYENKKDLKITAVFDNIPKKSSAQFDYIINWQTFLEINNWAKNWTNNGPLTYIMLRKGTDTKAFETRIAGFLDNYNKEQTATNYIRLGIQRYGDTYLHSGFKDGELSGGRVQYSQIFSVVAIFILLIACVNFMNLTTARSLHRAKEIGVRKVIGALRSSLIKQFIGEALLVVTLAVFFALLIVILILPPFNQLTQKQIVLPFNQSYFWLCIGVLILITGLISGSYPALYLSRFNPVRVLKGSLKFTSRALWFRKGLVVFQFVLSIILIIGTIVISRQVDYTQSINLGYDRENLIYIPMEGDLTAKYALFKNQALRMPGVKEITRMSQNPTRINNGTTGVDWEGKNPATNVDFANVAAGYDFMRTMHAQMVMGRDFSKDFATDSVGYIVNETAVKIIGYKDPIGKPFTLWQKKGTIIGVVKDFHFNSLHAVINPLILRLGENDDYGTALVRTEPGKTKEALASLEKICKDLNPKFPFTYKFSDEEYQKLYSGEQVVGQLSNYFAFLAIFISCLGLLGLVIFTAQQRTKEFGIRKVLGASAGTLFNLLSKEFLLLVFVAMIIASPIAWLAMNNWLQDYEYRINISWWIFVVAGMLALLIALITISFQTIKTALTNPVKSLRAE